MELRKESENLNRSYDAEGNSNERIDNVQYQILDSKGNVIGNASVSNGYANANFNISDFATIEEGEQRLAAIFGELKE